MAPARQTVCQNGHDNWRRNSRGERFCVTCRKDRRTECRTCVKGHDDWTVRGDGRRLCLTCERDRDAVRRRKNGMPIKGRSWSEYGREGDRGPRIDTYTYTEIMRARGYVA